jgi:hypothetical protein
MLLSDTHSCGRAWNGERARARGAGGGSHFLCARPGVRGQTLGRSTGAPNPLTPPPLKTHGSAHQVVPVGLRPVPALRSHTQAQGPLRRGSGSERARACCRAAPCPPAAGWRRPGACEGVGEGLRGARSRELAPPAAAGCVGAPSRAPPSPLPASALAPPRLGDLAVLAGVEPLAHALARVALRAPGPARGRARGRSSRRARVAARARRRRRRRCRRCTARACRGQSANALGVLHGVCGHFGALVDVSVRQNEVRRA